MPPGNTAQHHGWQVTLLLPRQGLPTHSHTPCAPLTHEEHVRGGRGGVAMHVLRQHPDLPVPRRQRQHHAPRALAAQAAQGHAVHHGAQAAVAVHQGRVLGANGVVDGGGREVERHLANRARHTVDGRLAGSAHNQLLAGGDCAGLPVAVGGRHLKLPHTSVQGEGDAVTAGRGLRSCRVAGGVHCHRRDGVVGTRVHTAEGDGGRGGIAAGGGDGWRGRRACAQ
jgi:hypothetical protein